MKKPFATSIEEDIIKKLKIHCAANELKINEAVEKAIATYLEKENEK